MSSRYGQAVVWICCVQMRDRAPNSFRQTSFIRFAPQSRIVYKSVVRVQKCLEKHYAKSPRVNTWSSDEEFVLIVFCTCLVWEFENIFRVRMILTAIRFIHYSLVEIYNHKSVSGNIIQYVARMEVGVDNSEVVTELYAREELMKIYASIQLYARDCVSAIIMRIHYAWSCTC